MADLDTNLSDFGHVLKNAADGARFEHFVFEARYDRADQEFHVVLYEKYHASSEKLFKRRGSGKTFRAALNRALDKWFFQ